MSPKKPIPASTIAKVKETVLDTKEKAQATLDRDLNSTAINFIVDEVADLYRGSVMDLEKKDREEVRRFIVEEFGPLESTRSGESNESSVMRLESSLLVIEEEEERQGGAFQTVN